MNKTNTKPVSSSRSAGKTGLQNSSKILTARSEKKSKIRMSHNESGPTSKENTSPMPQKQTPLSARSNSPNMLLVRKSYSGLHQLSKELKDGKNESPLKQTSFSSYSLQHSRNKSGTIRTINPFRVDETMKTSVDLSDYDMKGTSKIYSPNKSFQQNKKVIAARDQGYEAFINYLNRSSEFQLLSPKIDLVRQYMAENIGPVFQQTPVQQQLNDTSKIKKQKYRPHKVKSLAETENAVIKIQRFFRKSKEQLAAKNILQNSQRAPLEAIKQNTLQVQQINPQKSFKQKILKESKNHGNSENMEQTISEQVVAKMTKLKDLMTIYFKNVEKALNDQIKRYFDLENKYLKTQNKKGENIAPPREKVFSILVELENQIKKQFDSYLMPNLKVITTEEYKKLLNPNTLPQPTPTSEQVTQQASIEAHSSNIKVQISHLEAINKTKDQYISELERDCKDLANQLQLSMKESQVLEEEVRNLRREYLSAQIKYEERIKLLEIANKFFDSTEEFKLENVPKRIPHFAKELKPAIKQESKEGLNKNKTTRGYEEFSFEERAESEKNSKQSSQDLLNKGGIHETDQNSNDNNKDQQSRNSQDFFEKYNSKGDFDIPHENEDESQEFIAIAGELIAHPSG